MTNIQIIPMTVGITLIVVWMIALINDPRAVVGVWL